MSSLVLRLTFLSSLLFQSSAILAQDADFMGIVKSRIYIQSGPDTLELDNGPGEKPFVFSAFVDASSEDSLNSVTLDRPSGADVPIDVEDDRIEFFFDQKFDTLDALDATFANGLYRIELDGAIDGPRTVPLSLTGSSYPDLPKFSDYNAAQQIDHLTEATIAWSPIPGGTIDTWVFFEIEDQSGDLIFETPFVDEEGALDGTSTSVDIPTGTLEEGAAYKVRLSIVELVDKTESYGTAIAGYEAAVRMVIQTLGPDIEAPLLTESFPFFGEEEVELKSVATFIFNEAMDPSVDPGEAISWTGIPAPESFNYRWSPDRQTLFCHYEPGLPAATMVQWALNPSGSSEKLRDSAGNPLADDIHQGDFFTSATSNLGDPDVSRFELIKGRDFTQTSDAPPTLGNHFAGLFSSLNGISTVSGIDLEIPVVGLMPDLGEFEFDHREFDTEDSFATKGELDAAFPNGTYAATLMAFNDGEKTVNLDLSPDAYPEAPEIQDFATTQSWDSTKDFTLSWDAIEGGTASEAICIFIESDNEVFFETPCFGNPGALDGTATEVTIPANSLPPGRTLIAEIAFVSIIDNDTSQYPGARLVSGFASITGFEIQTAGRPFEPILKVNHDGEKASVTITGEKGLIYDLSTSPNLKNWTYHTTLWLGDDSEGFMASSTFDDFGSIGSPERFYRAEPSSEE